MAALALAALPVAEAAAACYTPAEATAIHVRMLQSELMVAALACRDSNPELGMISQYNAFVNRHSARLVGENRILERHFDKHFGAQGKRRMDTLLTALANDASKRSMTADFCHGAASLFGVISVMEWPQLVRLSSERADGNGDGAALATCTATTRPKSSAATAR